MKEFLRVDVKDYVIDGIDSGDLVPFLAIKHARVRARRGSLGEVVHTYTDGGLLEKQNVVEIDPVTGNPGWIVTKCNPDGSVLLDEYGNKNEWIIRDSKFTKNYILDPLNEGLFMSIDGPQLFVPVLTDITIIQGDSEMNVEAGGFINITNLDRCYVISDRDFYDTYSILEEKPKFTL